MNTSLKINILLVDDERTTLLFLDKILDNPIYHLVCATSGQEALYWVSLNQECALVILDINLEDANGFEIAKFIRAQSNTKDTPIIFITGFSTHPEYLAQAYALGAIDYIIKPVNPDIVKAKVAVLVDLYQKTIQLKQTNQQLQQVILKHQQTEKALRERSQTLHAILDATVDIIIMLELDGTIVTINPIGAEQFGMSSDEMIGHCFYDFLPPAVAKQRISAVNKVIRTKSCVFIENERADIWFECNFYPVCNEHGDVVRIALFARDTTERKQVEEELRTQKKLLRLVIDSVPHLIFWKDRKSVYLGCNQNFAKMVGVNTPKQIIEKTDFDLPWTPFEPQQIRADDKRIMDNDAPEYHLIETIELPNNQQIWIDTSKVPLHDTMGNVIGILGAFEDITERNQAEAHLKQAFDAAQTANRAKSAFLANMSHELRTPLNSILGYTQLLKRDNTLNSEQQEGIGIIHRSGEYLLTLINDILDLSKIEAESMELYPTDFQLDNFLKDIVELFRMRAKQKGIAFNYCPQASLPKWIHADEKRLRQILINLLSNAIKFTKKGGVQFKIDFWNKKIRFLVSDTGIGIASEKLSKIFLPFQQFTPHYNGEGAGLGLSITHKLVGMMEGEIHVNSGLAQGSTFWVILDLPEVVGSVKSQQINKQIIVGYQKISTHPHPDKNYKILVVDDKWENRLILVKLLTPLGFEIVEAVNGTEAIDKALINLPDLILMDLVMPVMDGFTATYKIRQIPKIKDVVILTVSASAFDFHQQRSVEVGGNDFIAKPIRTEILLERLQKHLKLEWIYKQVVVDTKNEVIPISTQEMPIVGPSSEQAAALFNLAKIGDIYGICDYVKQLEQSNEQLQTFAQKIYQLADDLQDDEILQIAKHYMNKS